MLNLKSLVDAADLGDTRRNDRAFEVIGAFVAGQPLHGSENANWAHTMACYRFFDNSKVSLAAFYGIGIAALREMVKPRQRVYVAHDPSLLDYSGHNAKADRIPIGNHRGLGYELYTALVLDAHGHPLGPVFQEVRTSTGCYASEPVPGTKPRRTARFIGHIEQMEKAVRAAQTHLADQERVHLADREFDDVGLQREMSADEPAELYVVRAQHMRRLVLHGGTRTHLDEAASVVRLKRGRVVRKADLRYRQYAGETSVVLDRPSRRGRHRGEKRQSGPPLTVRVVVVELRAAGHETIRWVLLTNLTDSLWDVVNAYVFRWKIERYFYLTKVGFALEDWTQQDGERVARRLAVSSLAAMVIYQLLALQDDPRAKEALRFIATQGNWLGRKRDPIGPIVLMRGMLRILDAMIAIEQFGTARIRALAEQVLPGITAEMHRGSRTKDV